MPTISKDQVSDVGGLAAEGWHRAVVKDCEAKTSSKSEGYYNLVFESPDGQFLCYDVAMLEGRGNGIGIAKLLALGACQDMGDSYEYDAAHQVRGKECYVFLRHEEYDGKTRCKVDIKEGKCGYLPLSDPPMEANVSPAVWVAEEIASTTDPDDDIPF